MKCTIDLFTWAFSLDLLNGGDGALAPIGDAITSLYENVIGEAWMVVAILVAGIWGIWKALVQRRYTETAGALAVSVRVRRSSRCSSSTSPNAPSARPASGRTRSRCAFLSGANRGSLDDPDAGQAPGLRPPVRDAALPAVGGAASSAGSRTASTPTSLDADGFPRPVSPHDPARDVCRDHLKAGRDGYGGYAPRFLQPAPGLGGTQGRVRRAARGRGPADRRGAVRAATRSTRPTRPRSTPNRPAAPSSA